MLFLPDEPWMRSACQISYFRNSAALSKGWFQSSLVVNPNPGDGVSVGAASVLCYPSFDSLSRTTLKTLLENPFWWLQPWLAQLCIVEGQLALQLSLGKAVKVRKAAKGGPSNAERTTPDGASTPMQGDPDIIGSLRVEKASEITEFSHLT